MRIPIYFTLFALLECLAVACSALPEPSTSPPTPVVSEIGATASPPALSALESATQTPVPDATLQLPPSATSTPDLLPVPTLRPSRTPTPTRTPRPPRAPIEILSPGPLSKLVAQVELRLRVRPGGDGRIHTELLGEDGHLIFTNAPKYFEPPDTWVYIELAIPFQVSTGGVFSRLQVSTVDEYGRLEAVNSVHLLLLSDGYNEVNPADRLDERILISQPEGDAEIYGGIFLVEGRVRPVNTQPLVFELLDESRVILATRNLALASTPGSDYLSFVVDLAYTLFAHSHARLTIYQMDDRFSGIYYLYSQEISLNP